MKSFWLKFLIIGGLFVFLIFGGIGQHLKNLSFLFAPFQKLLFYGGRKVELISKCLSDRGKYFNGEFFQSYQKKLEDLEKRVQITKLKEENARLKEALNISKSENFLLEMTYPLSFFKTNDFLFIDKGKESGLKKNMIVIGPKKVLVGKIVEVFNKFSKVKLITNHTFKFDIIVLGEEKGLGLAQGKGNLKLNFRLIPKSSKIKIGDQIVTSQLGGKFPYGLLVGEVKNFKKGGDNYFQGEIEPYFLQLFNIGISPFFVIKNFNEFDEFK